MKKIKEILKQHNIDFVETGKNVAKGNLGLNCPFCGSEDSSYHLNINNNGRYFCWRDGSHKGTIHYLLGHILNISIDEAKRLLGNQHTSPSVEENIIKYGGKTSIQLPENFRVVENNIITKAFYNYLKNRGFDRIPELVERYNIKCCISGKWADRVIFPIYMNYELMSWIGRDIREKAYLRYRDLEIDESVKHPKYCLFDYDNLLGGERLYVLEGVFDALKMNWYTSEHISSTCLFTLNVTDEQIKLLLRVSDLYEEIIILLDEGAERQSMKLSASLSFIKNLSTKFVPKGIKDVGEMTPSQIKNFIRGDL